MPVEITASNFENEVINSDRPVLIDFWAPWCGPCKAIAPVIDEIEKELSKKIKICKINIDSNPEIANQYSIMSIPTLMILKQGQVLETKTGAVEKEPLIRLVEKYI